MSASFDRLATVTASTKRGAFSGNKRGAPAESISSLSCTPLSPVDPYLRKTMELETPHELLQTFVDGGLDIKPGDLFVVASVEYPVKAVAEWPWSPAGGTTRLHLILEDLKE